MGEEMKEYSYRVERNNNYIESRWVWFIDGSHGIKDFGFTTFKRSAELKAKFYTWYKNWRQL